MIELFEVKRYNTYDFIQDTQPTSDGTWLCSLTDSGFFRGFSYQITGGTPVRIQVSEDALISDKIHPTIQNTLDWLNNYFYVKRQTQNNFSQTSEFRDFFPDITQGREFRIYFSDGAFYTFNSNGTISNLSDDIFLVGDLVQSKYALRNNLTGYVTAISAGEITIDNSTITTVDENAIIFLSDIPAQVELIIAQMINYDVFVRELTNLSSENIGNYSYSKDKVLVGDIDYPLGLISQLKPYKMVRVIN